MWHSSARRGRCCRASCTSWPNADKVTDGVAKLPGFREKPMTAKLLDGKQLAQTMQAEVATEVAAFVQAHGVRPGLAAVLVGENPASQIYVRNKRRACEKAGMTSWLHELPQSATQVELLALIDQLNADP